MSKDGTAARVNKLLYIQNERTDCLEKVCEKLVDKVEAHNKRINDLEQRLDAQHELIRTLRKHVDAAAQADYDKRAAIAQAYDNEP